MAASPSLIVRSPVTGSPNYDEEFEQRWTEYDPERANQLLDELGLELGDDGIRLKRLGVCDGRRLVGSHTALGQGT